MPSPQTIPFALSSSEKMILGPSGAAEEPPQQVKERGALQNAASLRDQLANWSRQSVFLIRRDGFPHQ